MVKGVREAGAFFRVEPVETWRSKLTSKAQTVLPRPVRDHLQVGPGDTVEYRIGAEGVIVTKALPEEDDPFAVFTEWASEADDVAYKDL